ncbi:coproporphyrinogen III oxidase [Desulfuromonas versatilis]|uniref:Heme chaperone HemW n=1 Tax=Desulfuromonas versatilis TaxID=2802975 RepID=A0ABM8HYB5_9BACT|nr:radical SAM family heme chaperone HemW [Desulfuromonas versatilis]BCR06979.1 coproporphyrinogen III oxidase [Desulfuromonas versatilis]
MPALYLHVPFCRRKCPYCDFYSLPVATAALAGYPELLIRHLRIAAATGWRGPLDTVFFGGGTPSLLPPAAVAEVLGAARELFGLAPQAEISMEANPGTLSLESLEGYRQAGVNRLSLGVQSLEDGELRRLGRIHSAAQARQAVAWARQAGFANLSVDLMFALPGQTAGSLARQLEALLELSPEHLSCYGLSVEEQTPFYHLHREGGLELPDEETYAELFLALHRSLEAAGFEHYEISNYARPGFQCRHNLRYWQRRGYLGVGAGAHSFCPAGFGRRSEVPGDLQGYARQLAAGRDPARLLEEFDQRGAMAETLYLGLRTAQGVDEKRFRERFGCGVADAFPEALARTAGQLRLEQGRWQMGLSGWLVYDHLISAFL